MKKLRKIPKDKGFRRYSIKLRKILHNGFFVRYPLTNEIQHNNEDRIKLWRAVIDQMLKDIISHHMVRRNFKQYYDARVFFDEQINGTGCECDFAYLDPTRVHDRVMQIEQLCRVLREQGIQF